MPAPKVSIIILSHDKPSYVKEAIQGVFDQTLTDWEAVLMDSGVLLNQGFFDYLKERNDPRLTILPSGETPGMGKTMNMAGWCFNKIINAGMLHGELILYLCDDDLIYPEAFQTFWDFYIQHNREPQAMYASQDIGLVDAQGKTQIVGRRIADRPAGRFCKGRKLDCQVDYLQFCHSRAILEKLAEVRRTREFHREDKSHADHADGIFMEQIGQLTKIYNIDKLVGMNRRTELSVNLEYAETSFGRFLAYLKSKRNGIRHLFDRGY